MRYIKTVSLLTMITVGMSGVSYGAPMTSQIRRLMQEKEEKIKALEQCDGKRKGWMIAGISTIGLTAVGVGVNVAQASKSNRLSGEIEMEKSVLKNQQDELNRISNNISELQAQQNGGGNGQGGGANGGSSVSTPAGGASAPGNKCDCNGCKQSLTIGDTKYTCGDNAPEGAFAMWSTWFYICNEGCWKGPNTIEYRGIDDCGSVADLSYNHYMGGRTRLYFDADVVADYRTYNKTFGYYGIKNICKQQE